MKNYQRNAKYVLSGETLNDIAAAVNAVNDNFANIGGGGPETLPYRVGEIRVQSDETDEIPVFSAVALTDLAVVPEDFVYETPSFVAEYVTSETAGYPFAILVEAADDTKLTRAVLFGVVPALVTINDASHQFAKPTVDGEGAMESCDNGSARILYKSGDSGDQWCILQLGSASGSASGYDGIFAISATATGVSVSAGVAVVNGTIYEVDASTLTCSGNGWVYLESTSGASPVIAFSSSMPAPSSIDEANVKGVFPIGKITDSGIVQLCRSVPQIILIGTDCSEES